MSTDATSSSNLLPSTSEAAIRPEMVLTARQFLQNPRVQNTPVAEQRSFLRDKGLTDGEIQEAFDSLPPTTQIATQSIPQNQQVVGGGRGSSLMNAFQSAVLISGASYMAYKFVRSWVLPKFFDIPDPAQEQFELLQTQMNDLQNSSKFMMDSVVQTLETVSAQQEQLNRALMLMSSGGGNMRGNEFDKLHADIGIVKSLLLNQNQFPPIPEHSALANGRGTQTNGTSATNDSKKVRAELNGARKEQSNSIDVDEETKDSV